MSQDSSANNRRIAKNTLLLYFRMLFLMLISLYTSMVILNALGVQDYGIYNVVGGVATMFSVLSASLSAAINRFITFELGNGDTQVLKNVFSSAVTIDDKERVARILSQDWFEEGRLLHVAFALNYGETYLSVNRLAAQSYSSDVCNFVGKHEEYAFGVRQCEYRRAVLNVGEVRTIDITHGGKTLVFRKIM